MKNLVFAFALLCSTSLIAQFSYYPDGSGIQSLFNTTDLINQLFSNSVN